MLGRSTPVLLKAIAACLASGDNELRMCAEGENGLTPYFVGGFKTEIETPYMKL
jgi:hypothetical protein